MPAKNLYRDHKEGIYAHIYNKGVEKRIIFNDKEDYESFQGFLKDYLTAPQNPENIKKSFTVYGRIFRGIPHQPKNYFGKVELVAYSLMPCHFHLLLHQKTRGSVESFIRSLCTRFSMYFNKKYQRTGALFEGPYKSVQIKDGVQMLHLSRFFHRAGSYSSYSEYLGAREALWVKPKAVLFLFGKGQASYKDFVEKYESDQKGKELIPNITFETEIEHLEGRDPARNVENHLPEMLEPSEKTGPGRNLKPLQRIPEVVTIIIVFVLLITFGIRNVVVSTAKNSAPSIVSAIPSTATGNSGPSVTPADTPAIAVNPNSSTSSAILSATDEAKSKMMVTVKLDDEAAQVNIRQKPTVNSEKIGLARNGDIFEFVSGNQEWYEVRLATRSGFISAEYAEKGNIK